MALGEVRGLRVIDDVLRHVETTRATFYAGGHIKDPLFFGGTRGGVSRALAINPVRGQAAEAERLLTTMVGDEPALAPLLDAVRSARAVQSGWRPDRDVLLRVAADLEREGWAAKAWAHVQPLDQEARVAELARIREAGNLGATQDDFRTIAGILGDDVERRYSADVPREITGEKSLRDVALRMAETGSYKYRYDPYHRTTLYFEAWDAAQIPVETRRTRIAELLTGDPRARTKDEWRELSALLRAGGHDVVEHPWFPGQQLDRAARNAQLGGYDEALRTHHTIEQVNDVRRAEVRAQLLALGEIDSLSADVLRLDKLDQVGLRGAEASAVRLRHQIPLTPQSARVWLTDARAAFEGATVQGPAIQLRDTTMELIDKNLARTKGERWWLPNDGYMDHPDYAELGRIRSAYQLFEQVGAVELPTSMRTPRSSPVPAAAPAHVAPAPTSAADELLSW
ncbi:MAG: hypothetical protein JWL76_2351 [Thermoleophilia bacterium]|nr:hypothetical protein [Thermoleophilia bacterium]